VKNDLSEIDINTIFRAACGGDIFAKEIINRMVEKLAIAAINTILILNPQILIIGGQISSAPGISEIVIEPLKKIVKDILPFESPEIKISSLGENAGILGASFMAADTVLLSKFPYRITSY